MTIKTKHTTVTISRQMYERARDWAQSRRLEVAQVIEEAIEESVPEIPVPDSNGGTVHRPMSAEEIQDMSERRLMSYEEYLTFLLLLMPGTSTIPRLFRTSGSKPIGSGKTPYRTRS